MLKVHKCENFVLIPSGIQLRDILCLVNPIANAWDDDMFIEIERRQMNFFIVSVLFRSESYIK